MSSFSRLLKLLTILGLLSLQFSVHANGNTSRHFQQASEEFNIPVELIKAISFINTRMIHRQGLERGNLTETQFNKLLEDKGIEGSPDFFGIMGLTSSQITQASKLTRMPARRIKKSIRHNIRAAAALLRMHKRKQFADIVNDINLGDYYTVVAAFIGYDDKALELQYADEVFSILKKGVKQTLQGFSYSNNHYLLEPANYDSLIPSLSAKFLPFAYQGQMAVPMTLDGRIDGTVADTYVASEHYGSRSGKTIKRIVLHTCEGSGSGCINYLKSNSRSVSAHYVVTESGGVTQMVQEKYKAHHVGCCNSDSVGIEHGGYAHKNTWTQSQLSSSFALICDIAKRNNIPVSRNTIQAHADLDPSRRTDPGPYYPWDKMLSEVQACVSGKPTAKPDLSIQQLTWTPASPKVGDDVTFHATVKNANVSSGANVGIAFFINNQQVGFDATTEMNANATITFNMRDPWTPDQNGQFTIKALVDDLNIVDESNENNNIYSSTITISGGETTQKPDLVVNSLTFSTPSINNFVTLYAKVTNGGEAINQHFNLAFYINQSIVGTDSISSLEKGESHTFQLQNQWSPKTEGQYNYSVMVDQLKQIDESNEANNTTAKTITVTNPGGGDGDSGGSDCASESLTNNLRNGQQLQQSLRSLRDEELQQSIMGQRIVNLYYKHTDEVKAMIKKDWILRVLGLRLILRSTYAFQPRQIANNIVPLNKGYTKMTIGFIERAQSMGSDELKKDFDEIKELVNSLQGLTANELLDELRNY